MTVKYVVKHETILSIGKHTKKNKLLFLSSSFFFSSCFSNSLWSCRVVGFDCVVVGGAAARAGEVLRRLGLETATVC